MVFGRFAHANIVEVSCRQKRDTPEGCKKDAGRERARISNFETHGRITSGVLVHGAEHDAYILIAVIHRVGWPTSAALWVCPWEMAKTTCKESPRNKTTFESSAYPLPAGDAVLCKSIDCYSSPFSIHLETCFLSSSFFYLFFFLFDVRRDLPFEFRLFLIQIRRTVFITCSLRFGEQFSFIHFLFINSSSSAFRI